MFLFALTIFVSAFLLFQVQPLIAKIIVPWFGGSAAVWIVCLLFFQTGLLLGNLYAHILIRRVNAAKQGWVHLFLLSASLLFLPIFPDAAWKPASGSDPTLRILGLLAATVGLPYFLLSATSPLLQAWFARTKREGTPYWMFALSNAGSMLGLLSYPFAVEPFLASRMQAAVWSWVYVGFAVVCAVVAMRSPRAVAPEAEAELPAEPDSATRWLWVALAACGSALLCSVTNHMTQNIAAIPMLWVLPLSLYLLSFILCFSARPFYPRTTMLGLAAVALGAMAYALGPDFLNADLVLLIPLFSLGLFVCCMVCHGELARLKPHPAHLTSFYLMVSLGGCLGGLFVGLLAPHLYRAYHEFPIALASGAVLVLTVLHRDAGSPFYKARWQPAWLMLIAVVVALIAQLSMTVWETRQEARLMVRNFYGCLRVVDVPPVNIVVVGGEDPQDGDEEVAVRKLMHGTIDHGLQLLAEGRRRQPTSYFGTQSGVGLLLTAERLKGNVRVGIVGLGAGTLAAYARPGDRYSIYEINPLVEQLARTEFTFLRDAEGQVEVVPGDARLSLERQAPQGFDVFAVDAFSGDAIPVHLLTREALTLYFQHLKPEGVLALHTSNRYVDLEPVVQRLAESLGKHMLVISSVADKKNGVYRATWVLVASRAEQLDAFRSLGRAPGSNPKVAVWTDDYSNLVRALKR